MPPGFAVVPPWIPDSTARASGFHHGAPMPARPGSTRTPPPSSASRASSARAAGRSATPSSRHIHSSIAPAANTPPSIAYSTWPSTLQATVGSSPPAGRGTSVAGMSEHEHPGAVGGLDPAGNHAARAGQGRLLVHHLTAEGQLDRPGVVAQRAELAHRVAYLGQHVRRHAEQLAEAGAEAGPAERVQLHAGQRGRLGGKAGAQPVAEERVDRAHAERSGIACSRHRLVILEQPGELGSREVGVEGEAAAAPVSRPRARRGDRAPAESACPATRRSDCSGSPLSASQASTDSPWWSRPHPTTSPGASASSSATASTTAASTSSPSCSTQPGWGWRLTLSRRASRTGRSCSSNSAALTPVVPSSMPSSSICVSYHTVLECRGALRVGSRKGPVDQPYCEGK